jgi:hypothetical protein
MRRRTRSFLLLALPMLLLAGLIGPATSPASAGPDNPGSDEARFVALVNEARAQRGVAPLSVDGELTALARSWANHQADGGCGLKEDGSKRNICHADPISNGVSANWNRLGENVGYGGDVDSVMRAFINSPSHYDNLMDARFTRIGVGVVWRDNALTTTHRFMQLRGENPAAPPANPSQPSTPSQPRAPAPPAAPVIPLPPPPPPPTAAPSRVAVVLAALRTAGL